MNQKDYKYLYKKYKNKYLNLKYINSYCKLNNSICKLGPDINSYSIKCIHDLEKCNKNAIFKTFGSININNRLDPLLY